MCRVCPPEAGLRTPARLGGREMRGAEVWAVVAPYSSLLSRGWAGRLGGGSAGRPGGQAGTGHTTLDTAQTTPAQVASAGRDYWGEREAPRFLPTRHILYSRA